MFGVCILYTRYNVHTHTSDRVVVVIVGRRRCDGCGFSGDDEFMATGNNRRPPYVFYILHVLNLLAVLSTSARAVLWGCVFLNFRWPRTSVTMRASCIPRYSPDDAAGEKDTVRSRRRPRPRYKKNCDGAPKDGTAPRSPPMQRNNKGDGGECRRLVESYRYDPPTCVIL